MNKLSVSVVVTIFNAESYLERCINSIINQTFKNIEILLIDDGSTDKSLDICIKFSQKDNRILVIHKKNAGLVAARKTGIQCATGTYISFIDADDYIDLDMYELIMKKLDLKEPDIVAFNLLEEYSNRITKKENHYHNITYSDKNIADFLFPSMLSYGAFFDFGILPNLACKLIKLEFIKEVSFEVDNIITIGEDACVTFQLLVNAGMIQFIECAPYHYCKRNNSMMWQSININSLLRLKDILSHAFYKVGVYAIMEQQLNDYITFVSLLKKPEIILNEIVIFEDSKIALYGAGGFGQAIYQTYRRNISIWVDANFKTYESLDYKVYPVEILISNKAEFDKVFIAILNTQICQVVKDNLISMGISKPIIYYDSKANGTIEINKLLEKQEIINLE